VFPIKVNTGKENRKGRHKLEGLVVDDRMLYTC